MPLSQHLALPCQGVPVIHLLPPITLYATYPKIGPIPLTYALIASKPEEFAPLILEKQPMSWIRFKTDLVFIRLLFAYTIYFKIWRCSSFNFSNFFLCGNFFSDIFFNPWSSYDKSSSSLPIYCLLWNFVTVKWVFFSFEENNWRFGIKLTKEEEEKWT